MNPKRVDYVRLLFASLAKPPAIEVDGESIIIGQTITITPTQIERKSIARTVMVPGFTVDVAMPTPGTPVSPPDVDVCDIAETQQFEQAASEAFLAWAKIIADHVQDHASAQAFAEELHGGDQGPGVNFYAGPSVADLQKCADAHLALGSKYEAAGNTRGSAQLRAVGNLLYMVLNRHPWSTVLPDTTDQPRRPSGYVAEHYDEGHSHIYNTKGTLIVKFNRAIREAIRRDLADMVIGELDLHDQFPDTDQETT
jgi:hypothetical protein